MKRSRTTTRKGSKEELPPVDPLFLPIVEMFADRRDVSRQKRFSTSSVLSVKGKIFAMLVKGRFVVKLSRKYADYLVESGLADQFDPGHGRLMKQWVSVDEEGPPWPELALAAYQLVKTTKR